MVEWLYLDREHLCPSYRVAVCVCVRVCVCENLTLRDRQTEGEERKTVRV